MRNVKSIIVSVVCINLIALAVFAETKEGKYEDINIESCYSHRNGQDYEKAIISGEKAIKSSPNDFNSHFCLGSTYQKMGELKLALVELKKSESLAKTKNELAANASFLGTINQYMGNADEAIKQYNRALTLQRELNNLNGIAGELNNLATIYSSMNQTDKALEYYRDSLNTEPDQLKKSTCYANIAMVLAEQGKFEEAAAAIGNAINISEKAGDFHGQAENTVNLGYIQFREGNYTKAKPTLQEGLKKIQEVGDVRFEAKTLQLLGWVCKKLGDKPLSKDYLQKALVIYTRIGAKESVKQVQSSIDALI